MPEDARRPAQAAIRTELGAIFVSLELSRRTWLITSLSPGVGRRCPSTRFRRARCLGSASVCRAQAQSCGADRRDFPIIVIQEAGLGGSQFAKILSNLGGDADALAMCFTSVAPAPDRAPSPQGSARGSARSPASAARRDSWLRNRPS